MRRREFLAGIAGAAHAGHGASLHRDRIEIQHPHEPGRRRVSNHHLHEVGIAGFRPAQRGRVDVDGDVVGAIGETVEGCVFLRCWGDVGRAAQLFERAGVRSRVGGCLHRALVKIHERCIQGQSHERYQDDERDPCENHDRSSLPVSITPVAPMCSYHLKASISY